jgi:putative phage-type endonuclease
MSFGNINKILDKTYQLVSTTKNVTSQELVLIKNKIHKEIPSATPQIIDEIFNRLVTPSFTFKNEICFDNGINCFREFEETYPDIKVPTKYKKLSDHFNKLQNLPQPAQRSKEWYDYRYNRITASDAAAAIDLNPYEPVESFILKKCDPNFPFLDNATVFHGKKYEPTATMIYEHIYNTRVFEFGALPSDKYKILGASPDGISSRFTLDNKFSDRLGTMLEIKCPVTREIHTTGNTVGDICPFYYYCQVQQQLICCELDVCDFWQCKLSEYNNRDEYLADDCKNCACTIGNKGDIMNVDDRLKKGIILEFYPKTFTPEFDGDLAEWKSKYIIPKRLDMDTDQYNTWTIKMLDEYKELYPDISKDYYFYRIIYWKLEMSHNVAVPRDDKFFGSILPILEETWGKIVYYRENQDKLDELKKIVTKRKKYIKMNLTFTNHNDSIIKNKALILQPNFDCKTLFVAPIVKKNNYYKNNYVKKEVIIECESDNDDFTDNKNCDFIDT